MAAVAVLFITVTGPPDITHAETRHFDDEETVTNLTAIQGNKVNMVAQWSKASVVLPEAKKPGYTIEGWYKDPEGTIPVGKPGDTYTPTDPDETLYAKWIPKEYTIFFDTNLDHTETGRYTLVEPVGDTSDMKVIFDEPFGPLPTLAMDGYDFEGWYDQAVDGSEIDTSKNYTNDFDQTVYAHWKNLSPVDVKLFATNGTETSVVTDKSTEDVNTDWSNTPYTLWANAADPGDGIYSAVIKRSDTYSNDVFDTLTYDKITELTEENATFRQYSIEGSTSVLLSVADTEGEKTGRQLDGVTNTKKMNLKIDTKAPTATMTVSLGTHDNPLDTTNTKEWEDWKIYDSKAYGAKVTINISDENDDAVGGKQDVSGIKHVWLTIYDTDNPDNKTDVELVADGSENLYTYSFDDILDINSMMPNCMHLTFELHAIDVAGNEMPVVTEGAERKPEIYAKVEKLTNDSTGDPLLFKAGYRGRLYIYTTGWVDTITNIFVRQAKRNRRKHSETVEKQWVYGERCPGSHGI